MSSGECNVRRAGGFTLLELMIVVAILAIIASVGVPQYISALRTARVGKAKHELVTISNAVSSYMGTNGGKLPLSLYQVGYGGKNDPWGVPYCYLNYSDGTGDGLEWAIEAGLVDPAAFGPVAGDGGDDGGDGGAAALDADWAPQQAQSVSEKTRLNYDALQTTLGRSIDVVERAAIQESVSTEGNFSMFTGVNADRTRRRDRYMFPLNTDFDLFSLGPDHATATSLGESSGLDDVIRANNGGFFGVAADY